MMTSNNYQKKIKKKLNIQKMRMNTQLMRAIMNQLFSKTTNKYNSNQKHLIKCVVKLNFRKGYKFLL